MPAIEYKFEKLKTKETFETIENEDVLKRKSVISDTNDEKNLYFL